MPRRYWYVILTYILMQFSGIIGFPLLKSFMDGSNAQLIGTWTVISFPVALIIVLLLMKPDMNETTLRRDVTAGTLILWSVLGIFMALFAQYISAMIETFVFGIEPGSQNTQDLMNIAREAPIFLLVPALFAPILEEIIFRKIIFGSLYKRMNFFFAAILSALVFSFVHGEPAHTLVYAGMGLVFAFLYVKTKRIIVPIFAHMAMNTLVVFVQLNISPEQLEQMEEQLEQLQTILIGG